MYVNKTATGRRHVCVECRRKSNTEWAKDRRNTDLEFYAKLLGNNKRYRTKGSTYRDHLLHKRKKAKSDYYGNLVYRLNRIITAAQKRAIDKELEFSISANVLHAMLLEQDFKCVVTGIAFDLNASEKYNKNPLAPSLDRKNSNAGYTLENIQIVCAWYNLMKNEWSDDDVKSFVAIAYKTMFGD